MLDSKEGNNYQIGFGTWKTVKIQHWHEESIRDSTKVNSGKKEKCVQGRKRDPSVTDTAVKGIYIVIQMQLLNTDLTKTVL